MKPTLRQLHLSWLVGAAFGLTILGIVLGSGGCTVSARQTAIRDTFTAVDGARIGWLAWDRDHQFAIEKAAPDKATYETQITTYRKTQAKVDAAFAVAIRAVAAAASLNSDHSLASMAQAAADLYQALKDAGVKLP